MIGQNSVVGVFEIFWLAVERLKARFAGTLVEYSRCLGTIPAAPRSPRPWYSMSTRAIG